MARPFGYGALLRTPGAWTFLLPAFVARLPYAMLGLGTVLLVLDTTHSYTTAGAVAAVASITQVVGAPLTGRLADRRGQAPVLLPCLALHGGSVVGLIVLALSGAPVWTLFLAAGLAGASLPQIGAMVRARWLHALDGRPEAVSSAFAFESVTDELTFVLGPVLATMLCTTVAPAAGLVAEAGLTVIGGLAFAAQRRTAPPVRGAEAAGAASALSRPGVRLLVVALLGVGSVFGALQVSITAASEAAGQAGLSGIVYGLFATGSVLAGAGFGAVRWKRSPRFRLLAAYGALVLGTSTLWAMPNLLTLAVAAFCCGLAIAPTLISAYTLVETLVDAGAKTEAFTWLTGAIGLGLALGSTVAGRLIDAHGASAGFLVPAAGAALGFVTLLALRGLLVPTAATRTVATSRREPAHASH
ncbi:MFS transporter [Streptacidiphilus pinicola]|uniref:MFS transporter n=1 Tax=Streptacidiphilus pinicola TaxID=2219663 RepID=A0A2X0KCX3_9ACTN|nr:MFS transporter [Streptacidiphilus pinicola]RAG84820.1 MFS transporter [Streptacidiphilus pinicola]